jgi:tetratricopeptide (TPR) repeat protein
MNGTSSWKFRKTAPLLFVLASAANGAGTDFERAERLYRRTDYSAAIDTLRASSKESAASDALIGKSYFMQGQYKSSSAYLEKAVANDPRNAEYYDWLGKAYGRRAEHASFVTALPLATKTRECFEKAVALNPANLEALGDLFEFYLDAPGIIGGGITKAEAVAARIGRLSEAESHYVRARLAEKRKDIREAESEYRQAMEAAPQDAGRIIDLANFLSKQQRYQESDSLFDLASRIEPGSPKVIFARAADYIHSKRNFSAARSLLQQYAALPHTPDDPPQSEVAELAEKLR